MESREDEGVVALLPELVVRLGGVVPRWKGRAIVVDVVRRDGVPVAVPLEDAVNG